MREVLGKYGLEAPDDGGPLRFVGKDDDGAWRGEVQGDKTTEDQEEGDEEEEGEEEEEDEEIVQRREDLRTRMMGVDIEKAEFEEIWERLDSREREEFVRLANEFDERQSRPSALLED
jgi:hypothetical protein